MTNTKAKKSAKPSTPASAATGLIVLGFDARQKPCGARFVDAKPALVVKAAQHMGLRVYKVTSRDVAAAAKKLPVGQLYANGRAFVPNVRQSLYSDVIAALSCEPQQAAVGPHPDKASTPAARGLPRNWDEIAPGHLVIVQESPEYGWSEAIVLDRNDDMLDLAVPGLPEAAQVLSPPHRGGADESTQRVTADQAWQGAGQPKARAPPSPTSPVR